LVVLVTPSLWAAITWKPNPGGLHVSGGSAPVSVILLTTAATIGVGFLLGARRLGVQTLILALVGGVVEGAGSIYVISAYPGPHDIPIGVIVVLNILVGLVLVGAALAIGVGAGSLYRRSGIRKGRIA
jgi:hypothetical protein